MRDRQIICIGCPLGCRGEVGIDEEGVVQEFRGYACKEGHNYAEAEIKAPGRTFTATVIVESKTRLLLPVKGDKPIPQDKLRVCMKILARARVRAPIKLGEVIIPNILDTGADIIATAELPR